MTAIPVNSCAASAAKFVSFIQPHVPVAALPARGASHSFRYRGIGGLLLVAERLKWEAPRVGSAATGTWGSRYNQSGAAEAAQDKN